MKYIPTGNRVVVKMDAPQSETHGFVIPDKFRKSTHAGTVVAVGSGKRQPDGSMKPILLKPQQRVLCSAYDGGYAGKLGVGVRGVTIDVDGETHRILDASKVLFVFPDDKSAPIAPIGDTVLVKMTEQRIHSEIIVVPDAVKQDESLEAVVVALGTGGVDEDGQPMPFRVAVGQTVFVSQWAGTACTINETEYVIYEQKDVVATMEGAGLVFS